MSTVIENTARKPGWMQHYGLSVVSETAGLVVDISDLRCQVRVDGTEHDTVLRGHAEAAAEELEEATGRVFLNKTLDVTFDDWPNDEIELPVAPVSSVTSVTYVDEDGDSQTWTSSLYQTDLSREPARIMPAYGQTWPTIRRQVGAVTVRFVAGYGATTLSIPSKVKQAVKLYVDHNFNGCCKNFDMTWQSLVNGLRWR